MEDIKEVALLPCPFCGDDALLDTNFGQDWWVQCCNHESCGATDGKLYGTTGEATAAWNRRAELQKDAEPVGRVVYGTVFHEIGSWGGLPPGTPLYTHPQPKASTVQEGWKVRLSSPTKAEPFRQLDCKVVDVGYSDRLLIVEVDEVEAAPSLPAQSEGEREWPTNEELEELWSEQHFGHPADFAADVLERWGGWPSAWLGYGGKVCDALPASLPAADEDARDGWMPIETAPKDCTPIDIWRSGFGGERCPNMRRIDLGGRNVFYEPVDSGPSCVRDATHWMPLPAAPAMSQDSKVKK